MRVVIDTNCLIASRYLKHLRFVGDNTNEGGKIGYGREADQVD